jgi:hypothetical protein
LIPRRGSDANVLGDIVSFNWSIGMKPRQAWDAHETSGIYEALRVYYPTFHKWMRPIWHEMNLLGLVPSLIIIIIASVNDGVDWFQERQKPNGQLPAPPPTTTNDETTSPAIIVSF